MRKYTIVNSNHVGKKNGRLTMFGVFFIGFFLSCSNIDNKLKRVQNEWTDTIDVLRVLDYDSQLVNQEGLVDDELLSIVQAFREMIYDTIKTDTSFIYEGKEINVFISYCALKESKIVIPDKYASIFGMKEFETKNFGSHIILSVDNKRRLDTIITKDFFYKDASESLKDYGTLLYPKVLFEKDAMLMEYSFSIPLTDIGQNAKARINYSGKIDTILD